MLELTWRSQPSSSLLRIWWRTTALTRPPASWVLSGGRPLSLLSFIWRLRLKLRRILLMLLRRRRRLSSPLGLLRLLRLWRLAWISIHGTMSTLLWCLHPSALLIVVTIPLLIATVIVTLVVPLVVILLVILVIIARILVMLLLDMALVVVSLLALLRLVAALLLWVCHGGVIGGVSRVEQRG